MKLPALVLSVLLVGCSHTEVTVLMGPRRVNLGDTEVALTVQVLQQLGHSRWRCGYTHSSVIDSGEPFHPERPEVTFDQLPGCGPRWGGK